MATDDGAFLSTMRLVSWNVNGRSARLDDQIAALAVQQPDVLALQEVTATTAPRFHDRLPQIGLAHVVDSFSLVPDHSRLTGPRQYGEIIASRWPLRALPPAHAAPPWPERLLSAILASPVGAIEVHTTHIPPRGVEWLDEDRHPGGHLRAAG